MEGKSTRNGSQASDRGPGTRTVEWGAIRARFAHLARAAWPRRRRHRILLVAAVALLALLGTVFNAGVQTALVRRHLAPHVEHLTVERVRLLPWSLTIHGLDVAHAGARVLLPRAEFGLAPWRLLFDQLALSRIELPNFYVDLRALETDDEPPGPFPGVFALLDQGIALVLDEVLAFGELRLADARRVDLTVRGGGVAPDTTGALEIMVNLHHDAAGARYELPVPRPHAGRGRSCTRLVPRRDRPRPWRPRARRDARARPALTPFEEPAIGAHATAARRAARRSDRLHPDAARRAG